MPGPFGNNVYEKARQAFLEGRIDTRTSTATVDVKAMLVSVNPADPTGFYAPNFTTDQFVSSVPTAARIGPGALDLCPTLPSRTQTNGELGAGVTTFGTVASGRTVTAILVFWQNGAAATAGAANEAAARLLGYYDTAGGNAISIPTNGGDITVTWPTTSPKIFKL
jgi:hypothetical protein